ncbi:MAG: hypothetical protein ACJA2G_000186 [Cognaticolwellia sp.]|jgi:hypothetical protein
MRHFVPAGIALFYDSSVLRRDTVNSFFTGK